jgi:hypothetical protein
MASRFLIPEKLLIHTLFLYLLDELIVKISKIFEEESVSSSPILNRKIYGITLT